jgi:hypothetical protein
VTEKFKYFLFILLFQIVSCTDQGDPIKYSLSNTSNFKIEVIRFDRFGINDTTLINKDDFKILYEEGPPYDDGPFGVFDSIRIQFEDSKILTYNPPGSNSTCLDSIKNPFCPYSNYVCTNNICTFEIDSVEYKKAR